MQRLHSLYKSTKKQAGLKVATIDIRDKVCLLLISLRLSRVFYELRDEAGIAYTCLYFYTSSFWRKSSDLCPAVVSSL